MKKINASAALVMAFFSTQTFANANFTISPKAGTTLPGSVVKGGTVSAYFTVTNNTSSTRSGYTVQGLPSTVTQNSSSGNCTNPVSLLAKASCTLQLDITAPVSSGFALCNGASCTTSSASLNVISWSLIPMIAAGGYGASDFFPFIATSLDNGSTWSYTLNGSSPAYPPTFSSKKESQTNRIIRRPVLLSAYCNGVTCLATGAISRDQLPLAAMSKDGGMTWSYTITPTIPTPPVTLENGRLQSVHCSGSTCITGGNLSNQTTSTPLLLTSTDGGLTWSYTVTDTVPALPSPFNDSNGFSGVNCNGSICIAVGQYFDGSSSFFPLIATSVDGYQYPLKDGAGIIQSKIHNYSL